VAHQRAYPSPSAGPEKSGRTLTKSGVREAFLPAWYNGNKNEDEDLHVISVKEFFSVFRGAGFTEGQLFEFYSSVKKSVILQNLGKRSWPELFKLEELYQWPVLGKIDNPDLPIYRGADEELLDRFIKTIKEEKEMRGRKSSTEKVRYWTKLQALLEERIALFTHIFGFSPDDVKYCETVAERYGKILDRKAKNRKKKWQLGVGAGAAATLAGAAAYWYISKKEKK
jgi:hypothetical protein